MGRSGYAVKKDKNQGELERETVKLGGWFVSVHTVKNAFDVLIYFHGVTFNCEVKNPEYLPKYIELLSPKQQRPILEKSLTKGEKNCMQELEKRGVPYYIIFSKKCVKRLKEYALSLANIAENA